jgi:hypothetical protein
LETFFDPIFGDDVKLLAAIPPEINKTYFLIYIICLISLKECPSPAKEIRSVSKYKCKSLFLLKIISKGTNCNQYINLSRKIRTVIESKIKSIMGSIYLAVGSEIGSLFG